MVPCGREWRKRREMRVSQGQCRRESYLTLSARSRRCSPACCGFQKGSSSSQIGHEFREVFLLDLICDGALCEQDLRGVELVSSHRLSCYVSFAHSQASTPPGQPVADAGEACGGRRNWQGSWQSARLASADYIRRRNMGS
jgi:hypothetical protein